MLVKAHIKQALWISLLIGVIAGELIDLTFEMESRTMENYKIISMR